ncbi:MAG: aminotransferase class V-fold PLP-dependent enzyme [Clostridia bacterium]|nr:aminotransferase class V-fold PLP-dependent enzyme [Clostridia bacterium]
MSDIIYLDNAATTLPKPQNVASVLCSCCNKYGNPGRSSHVLSMNSTRLVYSCREIICSLFNYSHPENVIFTYNTTYALNIAIFGLCPDNGEIIISNLEHNSVLRPVHALCEKSQGKLTYKVFDALESDEKCVSSFLNCISGKTRLAVISSCSNVTGKLIPIHKISEICRQKGIKLIIDAAQSAGIVPLDLSTLYFSAVCCAGHKSLYGVMGSGFCIFSHIENPEAFIVGGNGTQSLSPLQNGILPEKLESGTLGVIPICTLREGIKHILCVGQEEIYSRCRKLSETLTLSLKNIPGISVIGECENKVGTVLFNVNNKSSESVSQALSRKGICTRGGFHCSLLAHKALGTENTGGVRASFSHFNTEKDVEILINELYNITRN